MKILGVRFLVVFVLLAGASFAVANPFKSKIITSSPLEISVPSDHFLKITNFSQEGGTDRGVVSVTFNGEGNSGTANVLTAIRIDFSTGGNAQSFPEIANKVIIAGPAEVTVAPITGATLFITYRKESNEGSGGNGGGGGASPTPQPTIFPFFSANPHPYSDNPTRQQAPVGNS